VPAPMDRDRKILEPLNALLEANDRLEEALRLTRKRWSNRDKCWIDQMNEPTKLLADHKLKS
jgi:hypothetical protein